MTDTKDETLMALDSPVRRLEYKAMHAYRRLYPDAPAWLDLHVDTRLMWLKHVENGEQHD